MNYIFYQSKVYSNYSESTPQIQSITTPTSESIVPVHPLKFGRSPFIKNPNGIVNKGVMDVKDIDSAKGI